MKASLLPAAVTIIGLAMPCQSVAEPPSIEQWGLFEVSLRGPAQGNPFIDVTLSAQFTNGQKTVLVSGFYDGDGVYRIRFSPPDQGHWSYLTSSNSPQLDEKRGSLTTVKPTGSNHGPMQVRNRLHLAYADGAPYFCVGTTCYAWTHQPEELQEQTLATLASSPFNKLRMCIFPKSFVYNANEPSTYPFVRNADGSFNFSKFDPENFRRLERRVSDLQKLGIEADLILFHPYDRWGFAEMDDAADDRYLRYVIARLSAYRNVWWSLANEYDFMIPPLRKGQRGNKSVEDFDRFFSILQNEEPYGRLRSIHQAATMYDHLKPWVTHTSIQYRDLTKVMGWREEYQKPIVVDECRYEGDIPHSWGNITGPEMVRQFWVGTICGGYVGHGETLKHPQDILWWSKGGVLYGESPRRIAFLRRTMEALPYTEMKPSRPDSNVLVLSRPGSVYLVYALSEGTYKQRLDGDRDYAVEALDTWKMTTERLRSVAPGEFTFTAPRGDYLLRISAIE